MPRCLIVSNRLPFAFNSELKMFTPSSGGLVSALKGLDEKKIGVSFEWMGLLTDEVDQNQLMTLQESPFRCHPVWVRKQTYEQYYNSYCNNVLWPLFHYERNMVRHTQAGWNAYQEINQAVSSAILQEIKDDELIWIHDFHLMLVPGMIKKQRPNIKIGFFLHIPFPSSEIFRELPQRSEILNSLLECDQIGLHDLSYLNHLKNSAQRILGRLPSIERNWGVYPISIDGEHFKKLKDGEFKHKIPFPNLSQTILSQINNYLDSSNLSINEPYLSSLFFLR